MIDQFLKRIDMGGLERMKHRLYVVGRLSDEKPGSFPQLFLFKHPNRTISPEYAKNFDDVGEFSFRSFLDLVKPTVYEVIEESAQKNRFTQVKMLTPSEARQVAEAGGKKRRRSQGKYVLNEFNWFIIRGFAKTTQKAFVGKHPKLPDGLLAEDSANQGREIYKLIRQSLAAFGEFQPETYRLIEAFSALFGLIGSADGLPAYGAGNPLPPGLPEAIIDFLFLEDTGRLFSLKEVDLSDDAWTELRSGVGEKKFCEVVSAFRDTLVGKTEWQYGHLKFGGTPVRDSIKEVLDKDLIERFRIARDAYTGLHQILRGKVLLSMVLQWVLQGLEEIRDVKALGPHAQEGPKDRAKGNAIVHQWSQNGLAKPILRATRKERRKFTRELNEHFDLVFTALLAAPKVLKELGNKSLDDEKRQTLTRQLPPELISDERKAILPLAIELAQDDKTIDLLRRITSKKFGDQYQKSFIEAVQMLLTDVLCPTLFQDPIFTKDHLRRFFRGEMMTVYLMAVFLDDKTKDALVGKGELRQSEFQSYVDPQTRLIRDPEKLRAILIRDTLDVLTREELRSRLDDAGRVLSEAYTLLENLPTKVGESDIPQVSRFSSFIPEAFYRDKLETEPAAVTGTGMAEPELIGAVETISRSLAPPLIQARIKGAQTAKAAAAGGSQTSDATTSPDGAPSQSQAPAGDGSETSGRTTPSDGAPSQSQAQATADRSDSEAEDEVKLPPSASEAQLQVMVIDILNAMPTESFQVANEDVARTSNDIAERVVGDVKQKALSEYHEWIEKGRPLDDRSGGILRDMQANMRALQSALYLIYHRYNENTDKKQFRNNVDRLTLIHMMLLFQKELGLGDVHSSLLHLLLDLVLHLDPTNPVPKQFLEVRSLTQYFDNDLVDAAGMTSLRQVLDIQSRTNLQSMIHLVSDVLGMRHLLESVKHDQDAEIVFINATADEFVDWLNADNLNLVGNAPRTRLNPINLSTGDVVKAVQPGLVYLTNAAFEFRHENAVQFLNTRLSGVTLAADSPAKAGVVLPPLCISTRRQSEDWSDLTWYTEGKELADAAASAPCAVYVIGPSSFLNKAGDAYATYIPAGYVFGAHFLSRPYQGLENENVRLEGEGRLWTLGFNNKELKPGLDRIVWGERSSPRLAGSEGESGLSSAFATDYYLYVILMIQAANSLAGLSPSETREWLSFYDCFYDQPDIVNKLVYKTSAAISKTLYGPHTLYTIIDETTGDLIPAFHYSMWEKLSAPPSKLFSVLLKPPGRDIQRKISDVAWFNRARQAAGLP